MAKTKKSKKIIREIKPKIKVISKKEGAVKESKESEETEEAPLEEIISDAPSAREFPSLLRGEIQEQRAPGPEPSVSTPASTTVEEASAGDRYSIQENVTEEDITRLYQTASPEPPRTTLLATRETGSMPSRVDLTNRELTATRTEQEEDKYDVKIEPT